MSTSLFRACYVVTFTLVACTTPSRDFVNRDAGTGSDTDGLSSHPAEASVSGGDDIDASIADAAALSSSDADSTGTDAQIDLELTDGTTETGTTQVGTSDSSVEAGVVGLCDDNDQCDDGNPCNGEERCETGVCSTGAVVDNGTFCDIGDGEERVCRAGNCLVSRCGDGVVDSRWNEQCDDGNGVNGDGCDLGCIFSCSDDDECDDSNICNGAETCDPGAHACVAGITLANQTSCGEGYACNDGRCLSAVCGNDVLDEDEECDDGNLVDRDGCDSDCTFSCSSDVDCDDGNVCNGTETCDLQTRACQAGLSLLCEDGNACTTDSCLPESGCIFTLTDADGDGQASDGLGECGLDCDDENNAVFSGAGELCDGLDNDCDGEKDETAPIWYADCDGDGFASSDAEGVQQCDQPKPPPQECARGLVGTWTARSPKEGADCWDTDPDVYPRANAPYSELAISNRPSEVDYDYDCNNDEEPLYTVYNQSRTGLCSNRLILATDSATDVSSAEIEPAQPLLRQLGDVDLQPAPVLDSVFVPCYGSAGWTGSSVPACGETDAYSYCSSVSGTCQRVFDDRAQKCR